MNRVLVALLIGAAGALYYVTSCVFWPYTGCLRCKGYARHRAWWGGGFRMCGWCGGSGRRLKFGRWLFHYLRRKSSAAK